MVVNRTTTPRDQTPNAVGDNAPRAPQATSNIQLFDDVRRIYTGHRSRYGSPRVHAALWAKGQTVNRGRVERLMRRHRVRTLAWRPHYRLPSRPPHQRRLALPGRRPRSCQPFDHWLVDSRAHADRTDVGSSDDGHPTDNDRP
ncbi:transposase [Methylobacterium sp. WL7]|nr:transposase [Methylobacterium sp. WL7]